jgi:hypothetical protein
MADCLLAALRGEQSTDGKAGALWLIDLVSHKPK